LSKRDYYEVLGCQKNTSEQELKRAYRKLAMKHHPDRNPDDATASDKFKEIQEAYDVLSDPKKKQLYDQFGHDGVNAQGMGGGFSGADAFSDIFGDVFGDIFGGASRTRKARVYRGSDLRYELELTLEQAVFGSSIEIDVPTQVACNRCSGTGSEPGSSPVDCGTCRGEGQVRVSQGFFSVQQTCPKCKGEGKVISSPCGECTGAGRVKKRKKLTVKIPAGVDEADRIRLSGEGEAGRNGGPSGDLFVDIVLHDHPIFTRESQDLHCNIPISFATAVLGDQIQVPTLEGHLSLKIPPETQSGKIFRLRGKGVKSLRSSAVGDIYCHVHVETPVNLTETQKEMLKKFDQSLDVKENAHSPRSTSWLDRAKDFLDKLGKQ